MNDEQIKTLLAQSIEKAKDDIAALPAAVLDDVRAAEKAGQNRAGIYALLDDRAAELAEAAKPKGEPKATKATKEAAPAKPWQADDYTGPLTGDQAAWRHANIKPVQAVETK